MTSPVLKLLFIYLLIWFLPSRHTSQTNMKCIWFGYLCQTEYVKLTVCGNTMSVMDLNCFSVFSVVLVQGISDDVIFVKNIIPTGSIYHASQKKIKSCTIKVSHCSIKQLESLIRHRQLFQKKKKNFRNFFKQFRWKCRIITSSPKLVYYVIVVGRGLLKNQMYEAYVHGGSGAYSHKSWQIM